MMAIQEMAAQDIFKTIRNTGEGVKVSSFEIYGGRCIDLLNSRTRLSIREDGKGNVVVGGLKEHVCLKKEEMLNVMKIGHSARATSKTEMNETR